RAACRSPPRRSTARPAPPAGSAPWRSPALSPGCRRDGGRASRRTFPGTRDSRIGAGPCATTSPSCCSSAGSVGCRPGCNVEELSLEARGYGEAPEVADVLDVGPPQGRKQRGGGRAADAQRVHDAGTTASYDVGEVVDLAVSP